MSAHVRLDLQRIEASLLGVQRSFDRINALGGAVRDPIERHIIGNMLAGYRFVERLVEEQIDIFAIGASKHILELNHIVLMGTETNRRIEHAGHVAATELRYYTEPDAGIEDLMDWCMQNQKASVWDLAAGVYVCILTKPQLFIEGNHRTAALLMSYVLLRAGKPPFVLAANNALGYFSPASELRDIRKNSVRAFFRLRWIRRRVAQFLREQSHPSYLCPVVAGVGVPTSQRIGA